MSDSSSFVSFAVSVVLTDEFAFTESLLSLASLVLLFPPPAIAAIITITIITIMIHFFFPFF